MEIMVIGKIYELNGMIKSLIDIAECDDAMNHPIVERIDAKMNELINELEIGSKNNVQSDAMNL
ncbi:hypothetical protein [Sporolactobacillus terrae]|uniref:hypothetical protein n=1 Tax=Sporolactobacillus terrae TaxID=269673 RepID=UPI00048C111E|nr:hypothetical protein [Sporolactobacillus terrae]